MCLRLHGLDAHRRGACVLWINGIYAVYCAVRTVLYMSYDIGTFKLRERHAESPRENVTERHKETHDRLHTRQDSTHKSYPPGVLATKVGYFGVKSTRVPQGQMGT